MSISQEQAQAILSNFATLRNPQFNSVDAKTEGIAGNQHAVIEFESVCEELRANGYKAQIDGFTVYLNENFYVIDDVVDPSTGELTKKRRLIKFDELQQFRKERADVNKEYDYHVACKTPMSPELKAKRNLMVERTAAMRSFYSLRFVALVPVAA